MGWKVFRKLEVELAMIATIATLAFGRNSPWRSGDFEGFHF